MQSCDTVQSESHVDRTLQPHVKARLLSVRDWKGYRNPWMPESDEGVDYSYINLLRNDERYTGYKGEHAARVWGAIYGQPCLQAAVTAAVPEARVFYRLISGVHSSITAHIAADFLLDEATNTWGPNLELFRQRLGNPWVKDRVENLYFAYLFVLRAVQKAGPLLDSCTLHTGNGHEDAAAMRLMKDLVHSRGLRTACPIPFDEGRLWKGEGREELRLELQTAFQNITGIMDCVGCEKCKMWGKLQLLGVATSLKILFSTEDCGGAAGEPGLVLERNELIALVNLLHKLAGAVETVRTLSLQLAEGGGGAQTSQGLGAIEQVVHSGGLPEMLRS